MTRALFLSLSLLTVAGCSLLSPSPDCGPASCAAGCCDSSGACVQLPSAQACGSAGQLCMACGGAELCVNGSCLSPGGAGGQSGGAGGASGGSGGSGGAAGGAGGGASSQSCGGSLELCSSTCVDLMADENNCGVCGFACSGGKVCTRGVCLLLPTDCTTGAPCPQGFGCSATTKQCEPGCQTSADCPLGSTCGGHQCSCPTQQHVCGQTCVANLSPASCGASCTACATPANSTPTCDGTSCGFTCNAGYLKCGNACVPCAVPAGATATCSATGTSCVMQCSAGLNLCSGACASCPTTNATAYACSGAACVASSCASGAKLCNGQCASCPANAAATSCQGNACVVTACAAGMNLCGGTCRANTDPTACGASCASCSASANMTATCTQGVCGSRCSGTTVCKGQCGAGCTWTAHTATISATWLDVLVDPSGSTHAASVYQYKPSYHAVGTGAPTTEAVSATSACFNTTYGDDTAPRLLLDPSSAKPAVLCPRDYDLMAYRATAGGWGLGSFPYAFSLTNLASANGSVALSEYRVDTTYTSELWVGVMRLGAGGFSYVDVDKVVGSSRTVAGLSLLQGTAPTEKVAYLQQLVASNVPQDAGVVRVGSSDGGTSSFASAPWVVVDQFAQERDGTLVGVDRALAVKRLVGGAWVNAAPIAVPSGAVTSLHVLTDPNGVIRVAWTDSSGVWLASQIGGLWMVERVSATTGTSVRVSFNAAGKAAVAAVVAARVVVFD